MKKFLISGVLILLAVAFVAVGFHLEPVGAQGRPEDPGSQDDSARLYNNWSITIPSNSSERTIARVAGSRYFLFRSWG